MSAQEKKKNRIILRRPIIRGEGWGEGEENISWKRWNNANEEKWWSLPFFCKCHKIHVEDFLTLRFKFRAPEKKCNKNGAWISIKNN